MIEIIEGGLNRKKSILIKDNKNTMKPKETKDIKEYIALKETWAKFTEYGQGEKTINIGYVEHWREHEFKGYKIEVQSTLKGWKIDKTTLLLEKDELIELLKLINSNKGVVEIKRQYEKEGKKLYKSVKFSIGDTGDFLIQVDSTEKESKVFMKIGQLSKLTLKSICEDTIIKTLKNFNNIDIDLFYLKDFINSYNVKTSPPDEKGIITTQNSTGGELKLEYKNTYNNKTYDMYEMVGQEVKDEMNRLKKQELVIPYLKGISDKFNFLNKDNYNTLKFNK